MAHARIRLRVLEIAVGISALVFGPAVPAAAAEQFVPVPENGVAGSLRLASTRQPLDIPSLRPGQAFSWQMRAELVDITPGSLSVQIAAGGSRATARDGYRLTVVTCTAPFLSANGADTPICPGEARSVISDHTLADTAGLRLQLSTASRPLTSAAAQYISFRLTLPSDSTQDFAQGTLTLALGFTAAGADEPATGPLPPDGTADRGGSAPGGARLSWTGSELTPVLVIGLAATTLGVVAVLSSRRPTRHRRSRLNRAP